MVGGHVQTNKYLMVASWPDYGTGHGRFWYDGSGGAGDATGFLSIGDDTANNRLVVQRTTGNVGIGTTNPQSKLDVEGNVQAYRFDTGDITFRDKKTNKVLWTMFEDENGLYLKNEKSGEIYEFVLKKTNR